MYKLKYNKKSLISLKFFIDSYKNSFIRLINDSGIVFEEILIQNYIDIGDRLYEHIINKIEHIFKQDIILGKTIKENKKVHLTISINNFRLFVYYTQDIDLNERYIEDIEFFKK